MFFIRLLFFISLLALAGGIGLRFAPDKAEAVIRQVMTFLDEEPSSENVSSEARAPDRSLAPREEIEFPAPVAGEVVK